MIRKILLFLLCSTAAMASDRECQDFLRDHSQGILLTEERMNQIKSNVREFLIADEGPPLELPLWLIKFHHAQVTGYFASNNTLNIFVKVWFERVGSTGPAGLENVQTKEYMVAIDQVGHFQFFVADTLTAANGSLSAHVTPEVVPFFSRLSLDLLSKAEQGGVQSARIGEIQRFLSFNGEQSEAYYRVQVSSLLAGQSEQVQFAIPTDRLNWGLRGPSLPVFVQGPVSNERPFSRILRIVTETE